MLATSDHLFAASLGLLTGSALIFGIVCHTRAKTQLKRQADRERDLSRKHDELEGQLHHSQKMEAIGTLAGGIAHDFNNLLTVINGCGELLADRLPSDDRCHDLVRDIRAACERASSLTSQLLLFSRQRTVVLRPVSVVDVVHETVRLLSRVIGENINIVPVFHPNLPNIQADPVLLQQVLFNLCVNARDAMPNGGELHVCLETVPEDGLTPATVGGVRLSVLDTGCGMDGATLSRIFEPFFTTKKPGKGTGLGLATVYGIVRSLGGEITARSTVGVGTSFVVEFPPTTETPQPSEPSTMTETLTGIRGTVLLAEDDPAVRELTRAVLDSGGFRVLAAGDASEALTHADTEQPIDLILTDYLMPGMTGHELVAAIRRRRPNIPVVFMSGYATEDLPPCDQPTAAVLAKPFTPTGLLVAVRSALAARPSVGMDDTLPVSTPSPNLV